MPPNTRVTKASKEKKEVLWKRKTTFKSLENRRQNTDMNFTKLLTVKWLNNWQMKRLRKQWSFIKLEGNMKLMQWNFMDSKWTIMTTENLNLSSKNVILISKQNHSNLDVKVDPSIWKFKLSKKNTVNNGKKWLKEELAGLCLI